jgi:hypothetical protein
MRLLLNALIIVMASALAMGGWMHYRQLQEQDRVVGLVRGEVNRLQREIMLRAALHQVELSESGYPATIDPSWFEDDRPINALLGSSHPWVEIAGPDEQSLDHPPDHVATRRMQAQFWYNPWTGIVRARVPHLPSDGAALKLYNTINDTNLRLGD